MIYTLIIYDIDILKKVTYGFYKCNKHIDFPQKHILYQIYIT